MHPSGRVQVLQRLRAARRRDRALRRAPSSPATTSSRVDAVGFAAGDVEDAVDWFASAQYFQLSEDEKLSAPSFALMKAGLVDRRLGRRTHRLPPTAVFDHEIAYRDPLGAAKAADRRRDDRGGSRRRR